MRYYINYIIVCRMSRSKVFARRLFWENMTKSSLIFSLLIWWLMNALKLINFNGTIVLPRICNPHKLNFEFESLSRNNNYSITVLDGNILPWGIILDWLIIFETTRNCHPSTWNWGKPKRILRKKIFSVDTSKCLNKIFLFVINKCYFGSKWVDNQNCWSRISYNQILKKHGLFLM